MMKGLLLLLLITVFLSTFASAQKTGVRFQSSDTALQNAFTWASTMALHYRGHPGDPVGAWYESALPPRFAFCMRDVSHMSIGAEILGMHPENKNMFTLFTTNISASKDWCSYWEIDKFNRPSPSDYRNDREFWYNLDANFDLIDACWRSWSWTGDTMYLKNPVFLQFYSRSVNEYIHSWVLQPDSLLTRPAHPNAPVPFNMEDAFHRCRGLPSYSEGVPNLKMGVDLVAALYRGLTSYALILRANGNEKASAGWLQKANQYRQRIDNDWWDAGTSLYNTYFTNEHRFGKTEGEAFLLWFDALADTARKRKTIEHLMQLDLNIENQSYLPLQYYKNGYWDQAHALTLHLANPATERREYPEVSFGVVEAIVQGLMGVEPNALTHTVSTLFRSIGTRRCQLSDLPILNTTLAITHFNHTRSAMTNTGHHLVKWRAQFAGDYKTAFINRTTVRRTSHEKDPQGQLISYLEVEVPSGKEVSIVVK